MCDGILDANVPCTHTHTPTHIHAYVQGRSWPQLEIRKALGSPFVTSTAVQQLLGMRADPALIVDMLAEHTVRMYSTKDVGEWLSSQVTPCSPFSLQFFLSLSPSVFTYLCTDTDISSTIPSQTQDPLREFYPPVVYQSLLLPQFSTSPLVKGHRSPHWTSVCGSTSGH